MYFSNHMYSVYESDITKAKGKQDVYLNIFNKKTIKGSVIASWTS